MIGMNYLVAIAIGLVVGIVLGINGIIIFVVKIIKRKQLLLIFLYILAVMVFEIILICVIQSRFESHSINPFVLYIFSGASPGISLLLGLFTLLIKKKEDVQ